MGEKGREDVLGCSGGMKVRKICGGGEETQSLKLLRDKEMLSSAIDPNSYVSWCNCPDLEVCTSILYFIQAYWSLTTATTTTFGWAILSQQPPTITQPRRPIPIAFNFFSSFLREGSCCPVIKEPLARFLT